MEAANEVFVVYTFLTQTISSPPKYVYHNHT